MRGKSLPAATPSLGQPRRSFPLSALILMATTWAALASTVDGSRLGNVLDEVASISAHAIAIGVFAAALIGAIVGVVVGARYRPRLRNAMLGVGVGVIYSWTLLAIYVAPAPPIRWLAGVAIVLGTVVVLRIQSP